MLAPDFARIFTGGEPTRKDGVLVPIEVDGKLQDFYWNYSLSGLYERGRVVGIYNTAIDVTAASLAAIERDSLSRRHNEVLDATSDGVISIDRTWRFTYLNQAARKANQAFGDLVGKNVWEALPRLLDGDSPDRHFLRRAMDHDEPGEFASFYPEPLNHWLHIQVRPAAAGIVLFFRDITEEKRSAAAREAANTALTVREEELHWTISLSSQIPWTADAHGTVVTVADLWEKVTGISGSFVLGDGWMNLIHPDDGPRLAEAWGNSIRTGQPYDIVFQMQTGSGAYRFFRSRHFPAATSRAQS